MKRTRPTWLNPSSAASCPRGNSHACDHFADHRRLTEAAEHERERARRRQDDRELQQQMRHVGHGQSFAGS
jgi:hypothetical protein